MAIGQETAGAIALDLIVNSKAYVEGLKTATRGLQGFANNVKQKMRQIGSYFLHPMAALKKVTNALFNLRTIILGVATWKFGQFGAQVDTIRRSFVKLQTSVGNFGDKTLAVLREAVKGTVSDIDLMRATNNALLLGVGQTEQELRFLAEAARKLGKAVGRDTLDAYNDLAFGIGRQSRLILDNLGLIVKVGEATERYAASVGKTVDELTVQEERLAFNRAAIDSIRIKLAQLGDVPEDIADSFGRLNAAIKNVVSDFAGSVMPGFTKLFRALAVQIDGLRPRIEAIGNLFGESASAATEFGIGLFSGLAKNPWEFLKNLFNLGSKFVSFFAEELFNALVRVVQRLLIVILRDLMWPLAEKLSATTNAGIFTDALQSIGFSLDAAITDAITNLKGSLSESKGSLFDRLSGFAFRPDVIETMNALTSFKGDPKDSPWIVFLNGMSSAMRNFGESIASPEIDQKLKTLTAIAEGESKFRHENWRKNLNRLRQQMEMRRGLPPGALGATYTEGMDAESFSKEFTMPLKQVQMQLEHARATSGMTRGEAELYELRKWIERNRYNISQGKGSQAEDAERDLAKLQKRVDEEKRMISGQEFGEEITNTVAGGIAEGLAKGEKAAKVFADVMAQLFQDSLQKSIKWLADEAGKTFGELFAKSGNMAAAGTALQGLLGIAGAIYSNLKGSATTTADDIRSAVESTEAVRGIVAGPSNVAIAEVGNALKDALRTVETLLASILQAIRGGGGVGAGYIQGHAYVASTSSPI